MAGGRWQVAGSRLEDKTDKTDKTDKAPKFVLRLEIEGCDVWVEVWVVKV